MTIRYARDKISGQVYDLVDIRVCLTGGGFISTISGQDFDKFEWLESKPSDMIEATVYLENGPEFRCWIDRHERWNGWACPWLTASQMRQILDFMSKPDFVGGEDYVWSYEEMLLPDDRVTFMVVLDPNDPDAKFPVEPQLVPGVPGLVYQASMGLTWSIKNG